MMKDRSVLTRPLESIPDDGRVALGIHQSDIILRTAIIAGIADLRENPEMLDYVFASLPKDPLTFRDYGEQSVADAKDWFLNTDIPVMMNTRVDDSKVPCVTISLISSQEDFASIGDVHYQSAQPGLDKVLPYTDHFVPVSYDPSTGECVVPGTVNLEDIYPGMVVLSSAGKKHVIREVWDDRVILDTGITTNLGKCRIVSIHNTIVALESLAFKESFTVACHAPNEPVYLTYLHSIITFILLRYKEELIEARGLERTTMSSGEVYLNTSFTGQIVFSRPITVYGYVRNYWPKTIKRPIEGITVSVTPSSAHSVLLNTINSEIVITAISDRAILPQPAITNLSNGQIMDGDTTTLTGTSAPYATIYVYRTIDGGPEVVVATTTADSSGSWIIADVPLTDI